MNKKVGRTIVIVGLLLLITAAVTSTALVSSPVAFTFAAADLGQGCWGGGPLHANHTAGGSASCSMNSGQVVFLLMWEKYSSG